MRAEQRTATSGPRVGPLGQQEARWGLFFISPWIVGFVLFQLGPMIASFYFSLTEYNVLRPPEWIGLANYTRIFAADPKFWSSLWVTAYYVVLSVPLTVAGALACAILLNQQIRGRVVYRALFFTPSITPAVAATLVWVWVLNPHYGVLNYLLAFIGIDGPSWLGDPRWAVPSLVLLRIWGAVGGTTAVIFLSALQDIPRQLYEAAEVDGATWWQIQRAITVPMLTPAIFFAVVIGIIGSFQTFTAAFVATQGGPAGATYFYVLHLYNSAFVSFEMGYASALSWVLLVVLLVFTWIQFKGSERWVHYGGG
jgi:multiple sugar transport system permease protein